MTLAILSTAGSFNANFNFPSDLFKGQGDGKEVQFPQPPIIENLPQQSNQILGSTSDTIAEYFLSVPIYVWIILGIGLLFAVFIAIIINLFIREWARGALISSIHDIEDQKPINLRSGALHGLSVVKRFIVLHVIPGLLFTLFIILVSGLFVLIFFLTKSSVLKLIIAVPSIFIFLFMILGGAIIFNLSVILAEQLIIRKNITVKEAFKTGFLLAKKYFFKMIALAAINLGLGCAIGCATLIIMLLLFALIILAFLVGKQVGIVFSVIVGILIFIFILTFILFRGIIQVFKISNWTLLVREIEKIEDANTETDQIKGSKTTRDK